MHEQCQFSVGGAETPPGEKAEGGKHGASAGRQRGEGRARMKGQTVGRREWSGSNWHNWLAYKRQYKGMLGVWCYS